MRIYTTYKVKIKHYNHIFKDTVKIYRDAVDYLIGVCLDNWNTVFERKGQNRLTYIESLTHATKENPTPEYDFDAKFYKMPTYLRRSAINEAIGKVSSYMSNLSNWEENHIGNKPSAPAAGHTFPSMYRMNMYNQTDSYTAKIKVYIRNTWDWITVNFRKSDMDYIYRRCKDRKQCAPLFKSVAKNGF